MPFMFKKFDLLAPIVENICLGGKYYRIRVEAPQIAKIARPGQFCMIRPQYSGESLLRRPFSIAAVRDGELLEFAYTAIGVGTRLISQSLPGQHLLCLGPLGNSFPVVEGSRALVVGGGIGIAPFPFFNRVLNQHRIFPNTYYGARSAEELIYIEELNQLSHILKIATDNGSAGHHGFVTQLLEKDLDESPSDSVIYACGPGPMMRVVKSIAERYGVPAYLSMEETMGCGVGICIGCPIPGVTPDGQTTYYLCCKDGPIFPSTVVMI
ncbi:dihydroorotate dehydrogenase electron transfer subunit [bacterium]|nr:dihydroorotate dehydrogenase electron transfer subunit [bacterium]